ncbi:hypothetical protein E2562_018378 [Oryza meyeriana var. granulata]|uniref:Uncharacterized protein n=1 Tax=Oryza meyeriana var. granulata TaxID=110450 RepID=A0A6G1D562_9ORYZ|nr:hypothetical protein E2562_018378 [Oryza meyeriana var. granulata]
MATETAMRAAGANSGSKVAARTTESARARRGRGTEATPVFTEGGATRMSTTSQRTTSSARPKAHWPVAGSSSVGGRASLLYPGNMSRRQR